MAAAAAGARKVMMELVWRHDLRAAEQWALGG